MALSSKRAIGTPRPAGDPQSTADGAQLIQQPILQSELRELLVCVAVVKREQKLRQSLLDRLDAGAEVEVGELTARIDREQQHRLTKELVGGVLGPAALDEVMAAAHASTVRRLRIIDADGKFLGWHEGRRDPRSYELYRQAGDVDNGYRPWG